MAGVPIDIIRGRRGRDMPARHLPAALQLLHQGGVRRGGERALGAVRAAARRRAAQGALEKLTRQQKADARDLTLSGYILVDSGTWGDAGGVFGDAEVFGGRAADGGRLRRALTYVDREGAASRRAVEPHLLIYKQNIWYLYAWCRKRESFRLFRAGRIRGARDTGERFERRHFERADLPLKFRFEDKELVRLRLCRGQGRPARRGGVAGHGQRARGGEEIFAEAEVPDGGVLLSKLLSFGGSVRVLEPPHIAAQLRERAAAVCGLYPAAQDGEAAAQDGEAAAQGGEAAAQDGEAAAQDGEAAAQGGPDRTT